MDRVLPNLWQLRVFEAVARLENMRLASQELLRSQPAITSSVAKLETLLGVRLFDRTTTGTYPTAAGVSVLVRTRQILTTAKHAILEIGARDSGAPLAIASSITRAQARSIVALAEANSPAGAAALLSLSEVSLQRAVRQVEQTIGCTLLKHCASGLTATEAGAELARRLSLIEGQIEALVSDMERYKTSAVSQVTVGVLLLDPTILLTRAFRLLKAQFPDVRVVVVSGGYDPLLKKLHAHEIDFMIGILKHPQYAGEIQEDPLYRDQYCVVARKDHPLAGRESVSVVQLREFEWILPRAGSPRRVACEQIFVDGPQPTTGIETFSLSTIRLTLVESSALTVLSRSEALCEQRVGLLAPLEFLVPGRGPIIGLTMRSHWQPDAIQTAFLAALRQVGRDLSEEIAQPATRDNEGFGILRVV